MKMGGISDDRRRIFVRTSGFILAFVCCFWSSGFTQEGPPAAPSAPAQQPGVTPHDDHRLTLDVVVTDHSGKPVTGLQQQDFTLLDNKKPQAITSFGVTYQTPSTPDPSIDALILVDAVNSSFQGAAYQREGLIKFLRQDGGDLPLPISLVQLTDGSGVPTDATKDGNALAAILNSNQPGLRTVNRAQGFYGGVDRRQLSFEALERIAAHEATLPGRKILIWLGPGWPLLSGPGVELTSKDRDMLFRMVVKVSQDLRDARITLDSINPAGASGSMGRELYYQTFLKGPTSANNVENGNLALQVLAVQSGGQVLVSSSDIPDSVAKCLEDAKAYYTLTFDIPPASHPDEYHSLQIKIDKPHLTVRARTGYYAQP
jgi:VWFA-related protein